MNVMLSSERAQSFDLFEQMREHEQIVFCHDEATGLNAIIAIHSTALGPALGGCRMYPYATTEEALADVLRLSKGMTYKCLAADVDFGGGKAVIIGDPRKDKSPELFRAFGQFVESLGGRFYTGTDMGTTPDDFVHALKETNCIVGVPEAYGGSGDSSVPTAAGVIYGIQATNYVAFGNKNLHGKTYAVQGLGKVGKKVAFRLLEEGADLYVCDLNEAAVEEVVAYGKQIGALVKPVNGTEIYRVNADVFVPCAFGGVINDETAASLRVKAVVGSANNQLVDKRHARMLKERGIVYAPDYIVNAGGLIQVADELYGANKERVLAKTKAIYDTLLAIYTRAESEGITTMDAADQFCEERLEKRKQRNHFFAHQKRPKWDIRR
ncbi:MULTISPECIES: Glu/Leu/Phe/Val dehydrogenase dimerization domain-containing protein [Geobacillus]|jgi:phenylalanine dehydrogenase|uniref:L-phenylalanine dehydrogenase n=1 Tax=Geobacillus thermodenitrificans (strain NG80-2) TaxID=420246 RepID=A4IPL7_GEOTN|nr:MULTISPECIES: Glu/Leu/Phe/Val dehydrogenase dimerization domain-containing protein [Geobacillus]ABO67271.1 L-phenylalanine dehydrogenase [Geobacillus thermodenitrificans NG80-2]ARP43067.1 Phenylalanine dehydrogenase [Geobacillus thermodenitrificans]ATO38871.1 leucine dehydrogenase [Geobacillus thermodenitrificans]MEC5189245.1 phenylalanine dehydrogenase [Geobacillus thermodenitrificans]MED0662047.1 Glu/Leu/Phe/Val dehydrogenase [Geobacillus thermodenitrificans]